MDSACPQGRVFASEPSRRSLAGIPQGDQRPRRWRSRAARPDSVTSKRKEETTMKRTKAIRTAALALALTTIFAGSALASSPETTLTIRHQVRGCHAWSFNNGAYKASLKIAVARGTTLTVIDNDMMPHKLLQLAGP